MSQLKEIAIDYTIQQQTEASVLSLLLDFPAHLLPILKIYGIRDPLLHNPVPLIHLAVGAGVRTEVEACQVTTSSSYCQNTNKTVRGIEHVIGIEISGIYLS
jgi:hypothetical protein